MKFGVVNVTAMAEIGRNDHIVFALCVIYTEIIIHEHTDTFSKS